MGRSEIRFTSSCSIPHLPTCFPFLTGPINDNICNRLNRYAKTTEPFSRVGCMPGTTRYPPPNVSPVVTVIMVKSWMEGSPSSSFNSIFLRGQNGIVVTPRYVYFFGPLIHFARRSFARLISEVIPASDSRKTQRTVRPSLLASPSQ